VRIELSTDGGTNYSNIVASTANSSPYSWTIPGTINSATCRVRVSDAADAVPTDASNGNFTIAPVTDSITVTSPNGGESWQPVTAYNITWTSTGTIANVRIELSTDSGATYGTTIIASTTNNGTYGWTTPNINSATCRVRISDAADGNPSDVSNTNFAIVPSTNPTIAGIDIDTDPSAGGVTWAATNSADIYAHIRIRGNNFGNATKGSCSTAANNVTIAGLMIRDGGATNYDGLQIYGWSSTEVDLGIPRSVAGTFIEAGANSVVVTANSAASAPYSLNIIPHVYWVAPSEEAVGATVQVKGTAMSAANRVITFNGTSAGAGSLVSREVGDSPDGTNGNDLVDVIVPAGATSGNVVTTINGTLVSNGFPFIVSGTPPPTGDAVTVTSPNGGESWQPVSAHNITWTSSGSIANVRIELSTDGGANYADIIASTPNNGSYSWTTPNINSATCLVRISDAADGNPVDASNANFSITTGFVNPLTVAPTTAEVGQTIVVTGSGWFGANQGTGRVLVNGIAGNPTIWSNTSITLAVPTGVASGAAVVVVDSASGTTGTGNFTVPGLRIYVEDYEGGAVRTGGYYTFENSMITPVLRTTITEVRTTEAVHDGLLGAKVRYSYNGTGWGDGWGATLANTLDLSQAQLISFNIQWDNSSNEVTLSFKDRNGVVVSGTVSNRMLARIAGYGTVSLARTSFAYDRFSSAGTSETFDWTGITAYNVIYRTQAASSGYQYFDNITGVLQSALGDVYISSITPNAAPAGTRITISGSGFGNVQGQSIVLFESLIAGHPSHQAEIVAWGDTIIDAVVPRMANPEDYAVRVIKVAVVQNSSMAWESNELDFRVTAAAANQGGLATIYPNPFNPLSASTAESQVTIAFNPGTATRINIYIYDMTARLVYKGDLAAATQTTWNGRDTQGNLVGDGAYVLRVVNGDSKQVIAKGKILLIKK